MPTQYAAQLLDQSLEDEIVRPRCTVEPMMSDSKKIAGIDSLDNSTMLFGAFTGGWTAENAAIPQGTVKLRMIELLAKKCALLAPCSNELIADGTSYEQQLNQALAGAIGWFLDSAALTGTGAGQPLGLLNDPALVVVTKETSQTAGTIKYDNVVKMFARMHPRLIKEAVWIVNSTAIPPLLTMSFAVGTGGAPVPVLSSDGKGNFTLLTRPVLFTEKVPALSSQGDIIFAALSQYSLGLRKEISLGKSQHVGFANDQTWYRVIMRADGQGRWSKPFTPKNGSTLPWCVTLEAR